MAEPTAAERYAAAKARTTRAKADAGELGRFRTLLGLGYVVMDEVHYLADRMRGAVWEEVIIHLPESVTLVSLSATRSARAGAGGG